MMYKNGLSIENIASAMSISPNDIKKILKNK